MASFKYAQQVMRNGPSKVWGQIVDPPVNKNMAGLGFSMKNGKVETLKSKSTVRSYPDIFHIGGYLHPNVSGINAIEEDETE